MLFRNLTLFCYASKWTPQPEAMQEALERQIFAPCSPSQQQSVGWVPPRGVEHAALMETIAGQWLLRLQVEDKPVPAAVIKRRVQALCERIDQETGRKPGRKYRQELKEQALQELLPQAFSRERVFNVWINPKHCWVLVDTASNAQAGLVTTALTKTFEGLALSPMQTQVEPAAAMTQWLVDNAPAGWTVDMDCELRAEGGEFKSVLRYARCPLDTPDVRAHLEQGMRPAQLALTWEDRVSLVLTHELKLKRISLLDVVFEANSNDVGDDMFDADVAIVTGELQPLLASLVAALGGEHPAGG